jgi:drug/metabolite transporter (DMT)-like permease
VLTELVLVVAYDAHLGLRRDGAPGALLTLADTFAIFMSMNTVAALVLSALLLREPPTIGQVLGGGISMVGVMLITSPSFLIGGGGGGGDDALAGFDNDDEFRPTLAGAAVATLAGCTNGVFIVLARDLRHTTSAMLLANYMLVMTLMGGAMSALSVVMRGPHTSAASILWIVPHVLSSMCGHLFFARGCKTEQVSLVVLLGNLELVFAYFFDWAVLGEPITRLLILGGLCTVAGSAVGQLDGESCCWGCTCVERPSARQCSEAQGNGHLKHNS